jgi:hypothetical protein
MSPELQEFLAAEDLDDLLSRRHMITALGREDDAAVRAILEQWSNPQAVANLLFHPTLIPEDIRLTVLFQGLYERRVIYYVLAAVVGFQSVDPAQLAAPDRERVVTELLALIRDRSDILAHRASVSFQAFAGPAEAPRVFALMGHPDKTVRHNLRAWLFRTFQTAGVEQFTAASRRSGIGEDVHRQLVGEFAEFLANPPQAFKSPLFALYGYIPNLRDIEPTA